MTRRQYKLGSKPLGSKQVVWPHLTADLLIVLLAIQPYREEPPVTNFKGETSTSTACRVKEQYLHSRPDLFSFDLPTHSGLTTDPVDEIEYGPPYLLTIPPVASSRSLLCLLIDVQFAPLAECVG